MRRKTIIWTVVMMVGALGLVLNSALRGAGRVYVESVPMQFVDVAEEGEIDSDWVNYNSQDALDEAVCEQPFTEIPEAQKREWARYHRAEPREYYTAEQANPGDHRYSVSAARTIGTWIAALFTISILSFLYRDNPFYKFAESVVVGVTAAFWMVVGFWDVIIPNLVGKLAPNVVKAWAIPGLEDPPNYWYVVPLILGIMLLWRLLPKGAWIGRWPLAFVIGTTAGIRLIGFIHADFLSQIRNTIMPLVAIKVPDATATVAAVQAETEFLFWDSLKACVILIGVLAGLVYFFFSIEHKGIVGKTARLGIWFLMITFGAAFGYTVMGRIALFAIRLEFLFDDWLWIIDPLGRRVVEDAAIVVPGLIGVI